MRRQPKGCAMDGRRYRVKSVLPQVSHIRIPYARGQITSITLAYPDHRSPQQHRSHLESVQGSSGHASPDGGIQSVRGPSRALFYLLVKPHAEPSSDQDQSESCKNLTIQSLSQVLRNRNLWLISLLFCCFNFVVVAFLTWGPPFSTVSATPLLFVPRT